MMGHARRSAKGLLLAGLLGLAACASAPPATFDLTAVRDRLPRTGLGVQIVVVEPTASQALDSDRILVRPAPGSIAYLAGAQWADRLPRLVQTRLVQTFENARLLRSVGRPADRITATYSLETDLRAFEIDTTSGEAVVEITAKLVAQGSGRIADARVFLLRGPGAASSGGAAAAALDAVLADVMRQIVAWTGSRV